MKDFKVYQASGILTELVKNASDVRKTEQTISGGVVSFTSDVQTRMKIVVDIDSTGCTSCNVTITGKNQYDSETVITEHAINASGVIVSINDGGYSPLIPVEVGETYTFSAYSGINSTWTRRLHFYDSDGNWVSQAGSTANVVPLNSRYEITALVPAGVAYVRFSYAYGTVGQRKDYNEQFEKAPTASDYEQYIGTTISVTFPNEAGIVTDGTLTIDYNGAVTLETGGQTYILTSISPIDTLIGDNNIWADSGTVSVTYKI